MAKKEVKKDLLIENFVSLQKVLTVLSEKIDKLTKQVSSLLKLFEEAAKEFSVKGEKESSSEPEENLIKKLDSLIEQNKTIARSLLLLEEKMRSGDRESKLLF